MKSTQLVYAWIALILLASCGADAYCSSNSSNYAYQNIVNVSLNGGTYSSNASYYTDNTNFVLASIGAGQSYELNVTGRLFKNHPSYVKVWMDYNNDQDFEDAGESTDLGHYTGSLAFENHTYSEMINVPGAAAGGNTRMRISISEDSYPAACDLFQYGEVEDYTVNIVTTTTTTTSTTTTTTSTTTTTTSTTLATTPAGYCGAQSAGTQYEHISLVNTVYGGFFYVSGANSSNYNDFTYLTVNMTKGSPDLLRVQVTPNGTRTFYTKVWIDYNHNHVFNDSGEETNLGSRTTNEYTEFYPSINASSEACTGNTAMRIVVSESAITSPCGSFSYGEVEDYSVNIATTTTTTTTTTSTTGPSTTSTTPSSTTSSTVASTTTSSSTSSSTTSSSTTSTSTSSTTTTTAYSSEICSRCCIVGNGSSCHFSCGAGQSDFGVTNIASCSYNNDYLNIRYSYGNVSQSCSNGYCIDYAATTTPTSTSISTTRSNSSTTTTTINATMGDSNGDGHVNYNDLIILASAYGKNTGDNGFDSRADYNNDGKIDYADLLIIATYYERT